MTVSLRSVTLRSVQYPNVCPQKSRCRSFSSILFSPPLILRMCKSERLSHYAMKRRREILFVVENKLRCPTFSNHFGSRGDQRSSVSLLRSERAHFQRRPRRRWAARPRPGEAALEANLLPSAQERPGQKAEGACRR